MAGGHKCSNNNKGVSWGLFEGHIRFWQTAMGLLVASEEVMVTSDKGQAALEGRMYDQTEKEKKKNQFLLKLKEDNESYMDVLA